nr:MAG TPA: hypothetical protein [Caudoviricetes sp.]
MTSLHFLSLHIWDTCIVHLMNYIVNPYMQHFFNIL